MRLSSRLAILVVAILITWGAASCTTSGESSGLSGSCENEIFPVVAGASWTYSSAGGPGGNFIYTDVVSQIWENGFTLTSQIGGESRNQEWFCQSEGLQPLQISGSNAAGISMQGIAADFETFDVSGIVLPGEISEGKQWQYGLKMKGALAMPGEPQSPASGTYSVETKYAGRQTVTVPAGTFEAVCLQANSNVEIIADFQGAPVPIAYNATTLLWYAPGVGFIKSVENGNFGSESFTVTTELLRYSVP